ncbi:MAG: DUF6390 family protein [Nocardioides sp.]|nr:DUF6390 family protein [Nocardioides sp.]
MATWTAGERLFAQFAHAPNALGYCGSQAADGLLRGARGEDPPLDARAVARGFSGAWPYQVIVARLGGIADPMSVDVVRGYWTGNGLTRTIDRSAFGAALLEEIRPQAGSYWAHLNDDLLAEAAPTHAFHVLAVYPWSRLLGTAHPEPLGVLESCRIGWGTVVSIDRNHADNTVLVEHSSLRYDGALDLAPIATSSVVDDAFAGVLSPGDLVALHWGRICGRLTPEEAAELEYWTRWQLEASNPRIRASAGA